MTTSITNNCDVATSQSMTNRAIFSSETKQFNFTVGICTVVKDAEAYLEEWIDFHLAGMKFQQIFLYDNSDAFDLKGWYENTRKHPVYSMVEVIHYPGNSWIEEKEDYIQNIIYSDCVERFGTDPTGPQHEYLALIDIDEYLVLQDYPHKYQEIRGVLQDYLVPYGGALIVNWMLFGTSNHTIYAPLPITKRFQFRDNTTHHVVKSIVKSTDFHYMRNPHAAKLRNGALVRTTKYPGAVQNEPTSTTKASDHDRPSGVLLVYHYRYTSTKEYISKRCSRGALSVEYKRWCKDDGHTLETDTPPHIQPRPGDVFDDTAWQFLVATNPRYQVFEDWKDNA